MKHRCLEAPEIYTPDSKAYNLTIDDIASALNITRRSVFGMLKDDLFPLPAKRGRRHYFSFAEVAAYLRRRIRNPLTEKQLAGLARAAGSAAARPMALHSSEILNPNPQT